MKSIQHGVLVRSCFAATFFVLGGPAPVETTARAEGTKSPAITAGVACPSREFNKFMDAFAEDARVQRRFTTFPLEYRYLDANLIGTEQEDAAEKKRTIKSFETVPFRFAGRKTASLFPNRLEREKLRLQWKLEPPEKEMSSDDKNVLLFKPDTGNRTYYRFRQDKICWYLYLVNSRSV